jgi:AraC-like DNA-binding protein
MRADSGLTWEQADYFVDQQINPQHLHVWPFSGSYPIDVRYLILDRRHAVPAHRPDHLEIVIFESGELGYEVEDRTCSVRKNDVIVVGNKFRHRCLPLSKSKPEARTFVLSFLPQTVHSGVPLGDDFQYLMPFSLDGPSVPNVIPAKAGISRELFDMIDRIHQELPGDSPRSRLAIRTYLKMILLMVFNYCSETGRLSGSVQRQKEALDRLAPFFEHLEQYYDEPLHVNDAARMCAVSPCYFVNLFKEVTGQSFVPYLNHFRVAKAQGLLVDSSKSISAIAMDTGFCTQSYFGMVFRRVTGMTPLAYRLQCVGNQRSANVVRQQ